MIFISATIAGVAIWHVYINNKPKKTSTTLEIDFYSAYIRNETKTFLSNLNEVKSENKSDIALTENQEIIDFIRVIEESIRPTKRTRIYPNSFGGTKTARINYTSKEIKEISLAENQKTIAFIQTFEKTSGTIKKWKEVKRAETYIDNNGYQRFIRRNVLFHRWVMEKRLGRRLFPGEVVHHIDGNKLNNNHGNLMVFASQSEHYGYHWKLWRKTGDWYGGVYKNSYAD